METPATIDPAKSWTSPVIKENRQTSYDSTVASGGIKSAYCSPKEPSGSGSGSPMTLTVKRVLAEPVSPVTVIVYVVVCAGETEIEPSGFTTPMPLSIWALSAFVEFQDRVAVSSCSSVAGVALRFTVGGPLGCSTVKIVLAEAVPPDPVTVMV